MDSDHAVLWTVAVAASLGLHVLIVVALLGFGAISGPSSPSREPEPKAPALTSDSGTVPTKPELPPLGTVPTDAGTVPAKVLAYLTKAQT